MLEQALIYTAKALNQFLKRKFDIDENVALANSIVDASGNIPLSNQNKLVLSLINIEQDTTKQFTSAMPKKGNGFFEKGHNSKRYNLNIMLSVNFEDYREALKFLNVGLLFFQTYSILDASSFPFIPQTIDRFEFEMENISFHDMHSLWNAIGAKYQPSAIYQMRLITIQSDQFTAFVPEVQSLETKMKSDAAIQ